MTALPRGVVEADEEGHTVDATVLAEKLGLDPETLSAELRAGRVRSLTERGEGEDAGRMRLTFRHGERAWAVQIEPDGTAAEVPSPAPRPEMEHPLFGLLEQGRRATPGGGAER